MTVLKTCRCFDFARASRVMDMCLPRAVVDKNSKDQCGLLADLLCKMIECYLIATEKFIDNSLDVVHMLHHLLEPEQQGKLM